MLSSVKPLSEQTTMYFTFALAAAAYLEARHVTVPGSIVLRMLCCYSCRSTIRPPEHNGDADFASRHVQSLGCRIDDLINGLHGKVEGHEFHYRA